MKIATASFSLLLMIGAATAQPRTPPTPKVDLVRLYVLDCGTLIYNRPESYGLSREEVADTNMSVTCYLVVHPKGILLFDTGLSDHLVGRPIYENVRGGYGQLKFQTLSGQLADIGVTPERVTFLALSHSHYDHVGNANDFSKSTWLARKAEYDLMFAAPPKVVADYAMLAQARRLFISGDYDVFGDGRVILKSTPGHTPGHQSLYVKLAHTGGIVITGDLYHYPEERRLNRMPPREERTETPASRSRIEDFLRATDSQLWIGHSTAFVRDVRKAPGWYD